MQIFNFFFNNSSMNDLRQQRNCVIFCFLLLCLRFFFYTSSLFQLDPAIWHKAKCKRRKKKLLQIEGHNKNDLWPQLCKQHNTFKTITQ